MKKMERRRRRRRALAPPASKHECLGKRVRERNGGTSPFGCIRIYMFMTIGLIIMVVSGLSRPFHEFLLNNKKSNIERKPKTIFEHTIKLHITLITMTRKNYIKIPYQDSQQRELEEDEMEENLL